MNLILCFTMWASKSGVLMKAFCNHVLLIACAMSQVYFPCIAVIFCPQSVSDGDEGLMSDYDLILCVSDRVFLEFGC